MITWESEMTKALERGVAEKKPILLDFFNSGCIGCKQMGAVTFPDDKVADFIMQRMVPLQVLADKPLADEFRVKWTPTIIVLDYYGKEHHRTVGFFPPEEFIPSLLLGMGKVIFDTDNFGDAIRHFDRLLADFPKSGVAPEAIFLSGVSKYKSSHDAKPLKEAYEKLKAEYPQSEWTMRAQPYSLL
ncbi:MAG: thioredoxin fold domain-containing protein [Geobacteraceae bacterium]